MMQGLIVKVAAGVLGLLTIALLLLAVFNEKGALQVHTKAQQLETMQTDITRIETENQQLADEIKALRHDPTTIERLAREELKLVKPGEIVLVTSETKN